MEDPNKIYKVLVTYSVSEMSHKGECSDVFRKDMEYSCGDSYEVTESRDIPETLKNCHLDEDGQINYTYGETNFDKEPVKGCCYYSNTIYDFNEAVVVRRDKIDLGR